MKADSVQPEAPAEIEAQFSEPCDSRITLVAWIDDPQRDPGALLVRIAKVMVGIGPRWEALIVHDPSIARIGDRLAPWLRAPGVRLIAMPPGTSGSAAVREALRLAEGDVAIVLDAPMQRCPESLHEVVQGWRRGADVVRLSPVSDAVVSLWPSTALFRVWSAVEGLNGEWLGGVRLVSRAVLDRLLGAAESGVPEFTVWCVLTLPERVARPWSTLPLEPQPTSQRLPGLRRAAQGVAGALFTASTLASGLSLGLSRLFTAHPLGRWAAVAALLVSAALPLVLDDDNTGIAPQRGERHAKPTQVSGIGFGDDSVG